MLCMISPWSEQFLWFFIVHVNNKSELELHVSLKVIKDTVFKTLWRLNLKNPVTCFNFHFFEALNDTFKMHFFRALCLHLIKDINTM